MDSYISAQFLNKANIGWNRWINIFIYDSILISTTKYKLWSDRYKWKLLETCIPSFFSSPFLSLASSRSLRLLASSRTLQLLLFFLFSSLLFPSLFFFFFPFLESPIAAPPAWIASRIRLLIHAGGPFGGDLLVTFWWTFDGVPNSKQSSNGCAHKPTHPYQNVSLVPFIFLGSRLYPGLCAQTYTSLP